MHHLWTRWCVINGTVLLLFLILLAGGSVPIAHAAGITVNSTTDTTANDGACTLREAITNANDNAATWTDCAAGTGADTITFSVTGTITLTSPLPAITDAGGLTITGPSGGITISGAGLYQIITQIGGASLTLQNLTLANGHTAASGGAINANGGVAGLTITGSTFINNSAAASGGAIYNTSTAVVANSTFYGNSAANGGAIGNASGWGVHLTNVTFSGNSATTGGGALYQGSGVSRVENTIIANSTSGGNCGGGGTITNDGFNIDSGTTCGWGSVMSSMSNTDPLLGTLVDNGGPTQTMALLSGSPAIGTGNGMTCPVPVGSPGYGAGGVDQRGMARPQPGSILCDIGAHQRAAQSAITAVGGASQSTRINSTFPTALQAKVTDSLGGPLDAVSVVFAGPVSGAGITSGGTVPTNASGTASFSATANSTPGGPYNVTATAGSLSATFSLTNNPYFLYLPLVIR